MSAIFKKPGIVNVRMVITEEKILSNIDKVQKLINPASKKQIIQLEDDSFFKDLIDSIKTYLIEYPKKKNFPIAVYKAAYQLVEFATNQFEQNTKEIEELIRQREKNIALSVELKQIYQIVLNKDDDWKNLFKNAEEKLPEDILEALNVLSQSTDDDSDDVKSAKKLVEARINNLESNLHIEIDMERIEDRSKALSYIGIEIAEALKQIPAPADVNYTENETDNEEDNKTENISAVASNVTTMEQETPIVNNVAAITPNNVEEQQYLEETRFDVKPGLWSRIKNSGLMRKLSYLFKIRIVLKVPNALPEGEKTK